MHHDRRNIGAALVTALCAIGTTADAEVDGAWIDRYQGNPKALAGSCVLSIAYAATLASGETLTLVANLQDATSSAGASAADHGGAFASAVVATGPSGGGAVSGVRTLDVDLSGANQFVRAQHTLTTSSTGTVNYASQLILGGFDKLPQ